MTNPQKAPTWGYAGTVGNAIAQLQTFDPATPFYAAFHIDGHAMVRGVTFSRERVVGARWIDEQYVDGGWIATRRDDVPYSIVVWAKPDPRTRPAPAWQPIETAPKTLEPVLLWLPPVGAWAAGPWRGSWSFVDEAWVLHTPLTMDGKAVCLSENPEPTHWRALPPDPITVPGGADHG